MRFIRSYQNNIIHKDIYTRRKENIDVIEPEVFEDIKFFNIYTDSTHYTFDSDKTKEIIESFNYFTVIPEDEVAYKTKVLVIKYSDVLRYEFYPTTTTTTTTHNHKEKEKERKKVS